MNEPARAALGNHDGRESDGELAVDSPPSAIEADFLVAALDVGRASNIGWAAVEAESERGRLAPARLQRVLGTGSTLEGLADMLIRSLRQGLPVALGTECPLFVPVPDSSLDMLKAREGEGNRAFCAPGGAMVLTQGCVELTWILMRVAREASCRTTTVPARWSKARPILLWEAFVSGKSAKARATGMVAKHGEHAADALLAANDFVARGNSIHQRGDVYTDHPCHNLAAAAALTAGLDIDLDELQAEVLVIRS